MAKEHCIDVYVNGKYLGEHGSRLAPVSLTGTGGQENQSAAPTGRRHNHPPGGGQGNHPPDGGQAGKKG
ncbi:hypothetical protein GCM10027396_14190 [Insolitispirillum peregrinum]